MSRILVVDDEEAVRTLIELILRRDGHHVEVAANGQAGVDAVSDTPFDLAFVDLLMPGKDGMRTIAEIRRIAPLLPIVGMSGMSSAHEPAGEAPAAMHRPQRRRPSIGCTSRSSPTVCARWCRPRLASTTPASRPSPPEAWLWRR